MSVCPVPAQTVTTDYSAPGSITAGPPDIVYEICGGASNVVLTPPGTLTTVVQCCTVPGPPGATGCALKWHGAWTTNTDYEYLSSSPCYTSLVSNNSVVYIAKQEHTSGATSEPGVGANWTSYWDVFSVDATDRMKWTGDWVHSQFYEVNDTVRMPDDGNGYVCITAHTTDDDSKPGFGVVWEVYWEPITDVGAQVNEEQVSFIDGLINGVFDWIKNATVGDWLLALAAGAGVIWAGSQILDMMSGDGEGDGNADQRFTGTDSYTGAFTSPNLQVVVSSLMTFAGYDVADFDVTALPTSEVHFTLSSTSTIRSILAQLALVYQFDIVPSGEKIKFIPKYQSSVRTFTRDDLGHVDMTESNQASTAAYTAKRRQGIDLPRSVTFNYYSRELNHNVSSQISTLETYTEGQDTKIDVPFTLSDSEAKRIAEVALVNAHIEQQEFTFVTDYNNIDLEPGDIVTIPLDSGGTMDVRIIEITERDDGLLEMTTVRSDFASQTYLSSGVSATTPPAQDTNIVTEIGYSQTLFLELPPLAVLGTADSTGTDPRLFTLTHGYNKPGWPGAAIYRSVDSGSSYSQLFTSGTQPTFGIVATATPQPTNGVYHVWDDVTTISVVLKQGTLSTLTDSAVLNGQNWAVVGEEIIGFVTATLTAPNTYTLSRLLRGRAGTEVKIAAHVNNELFALLNNTISSFTYPVADISKVNKYKTVTLGSSLAVTTAVDVQPYALNLRPWRVAQPAAVRTGNVWNITWVERPRLDNELRDYTELNHDPDWGGYAVAILNPGDDTVKRTATTVVDNYNYTEADQITDFGSVQSNIKVSIVQMSTTAGGGYPYVITASV